MARTTKNETKKERLQSTTHFARVDAARDSQTARFLNSAIWVVIVAGLLGTGLFISLNGDDSFRYPKELVVRAEAILLSTFFLLFLIFEPQGRPLRNIPSELWYVTAGVVAWVIVSTTVSSNVPRSISAIGWIVSAAIVFLFTYDQLRTRDLKAVWWAITPAVLNAIAAMVQSFAGEQLLPFTDTVRDRLAITGFLGNPNDVGAYLVAPALATVVLLITRARPTIPALVLLVLVAGLVGTHTLTALLAFSLGVTLILLLHRKHAVAIMVALIILAAIVTTAYTPLRKRAISAKNQIATGHFEQAVSYRLGSTLAAVEMFRSHPLFGTGPGTYRSNYFEYKMRVDKKYARLLNAQTAESRINDNFSEAHNDHVEVSAEAGLPAYLLMLASFVLVARLKTDHDIPDINRRFAGYLAPSLIGAIALLMLGFFALQVAATLNSLLFFAATVMAWRTE